MDKIKKSKKDDFWKKTDEEPRRGIKRYKPNKSGPDTYDNTEGTDNMKVFKNRCNEDSYSKNVICKKPKNDSYLGKKEKDSCKKSNSYREDKKNKAVKYFAEKVPKKMNFLDMETLHQKIIDNGTIKDRIDALTLFIAKGNDSGLYFEELLDMCENQRRDVVLYIIKNVTDLIVCGFVPQKKAKT